MQFTDSIRVLFSQKYPSRAIVLVARANDIRMFLFMVKVIKELRQGGYVMDFVEKFNEDKKKAEVNKKHQGKGNPDRKLPNKQHSTNK